MKKLLTLALAVVPLFGFAQDDLYFKPSKKTKNVKKEVVDLSARTHEVEAPSIVDYKSSKRNTDEYNRRYSYNGAFQNAGGIADTTLYALLDTNMNARIDTTYYYDGYDMDDPELDYRMSRRLVRFHSPRYYSMICSPYYWDLMYGYGAWDYLYDPYDPWYWHYGWGYGWSWGPWDCWYGGIWGWHSPYHWTYWGWGPGWGYGYGYVGNHHGFGHVGGGYRPRPERPHGANGERIRTGNGRNGFVSNGRGVIAHSGTRSSALSNSSFSTNRGFYNEAGRGGARSSYSSMGRGSNYRSSEGTRSMSQSTTRRSTTSSARNDYSSSRQTTTSSRNVDTSSRTTTSSRSSSYSAPTRSSSSMGSSSSFSSGGRSGGFSGGGGGFSGGGSRGGGGGGRR